ncbi:MAG: zinc-binding dehydrogenase [Acidimicrobiales bacterium]
MTAPEVARALVLEEPRRLAARDLPLPVIGPDDGLLRVEACGLCGTDHEQYDGHLSLGYAFIPGHESVGVIERIGAEASHRWGVVEGDRVAVEVFQSCRTCDRCAAGRYRQCRAHGVLDTYGFKNVETGCGLWGGYATHQYLAPDSMLLPVPEQLDPVVATLFNPVGAGIRWGVTMPGTGPGDRVAVLGPGVRGLSVAAAAKQAGAEFVMVTGHGPRDAPRLKAASDFGADLTVDAAVEDPVAAFRKATGRGADVVVDVTAKAPAAFVQAVDLARPGGTVVVAGTRAGAVVPDFDPDHIVLKELRVLGALGVDVAAYRAALELLVSGAYPFVSLSRRSVGLSGVSGLLEVMSGGDETIPPIHGVVVPNLDEGESR